jgi:hypothetical protein
MVISRNTSDGCEIYGYLYPTYINTTIDTKLSCYEIIYNTLNNNTALIIQDIKANYWTLLTINMPELMKGNYLL